MFTTAGVFPGIDIPAAITRADLPLTLMSARGMDALADAIANAAKSLDGCREACVLWSLSWPGERQLRPQRALSTDRLALADQAVSSAGVVHSRNGEDIAVPLSVGTDGDAAVMLCRLDEGAGRIEYSGQWRRLIELAAARTRAELEAAQLRDALSRLQQTDRLQRALFAIADMAGADLDMPELLRGLHRIVGGLMYAENFYIALHDARADAVRFIYYVDTVDPAPPDTAVPVPMQAIEHGCTWYLLRDGRPLRGPTHELRRQVSGPLRIHREDGADWLGVPMLRGTEVRGALVVQSYQEGVGFSAADQALLTFVANHILNALERKQTQEDLEAQVARRTEELAQANAELALEIEERQRANQLQSALYRIADLSASPMSYAEMFGAIHRIVGELLIAENFYIAVLSDDGGTLSFPYFADSSQPPPPPRPLRRSATEYVLRHCRPLLADPVDVEALRVSGEVELSGTPPQSWLGVPLRGSTGALGVVVVQSYDPDIAYGTGELEILTYIAHKIAATLERRRAIDALHEANARLELHVDERTRELREQIGERERVERQLKHEVVHDALTGLPNRRYLRDRLDRMLARLRREPDRGFAVLYLDVDRFKVINDSLGHSAGDEVLNELAVRLNRCVRAPDLVARLGGDEFAVLLEGIDGDSTPSRVAQRILDALAEPMQIGGKELSSSASIGIAHGELRHQCADDVLRDADVAMYRAKSGGKQRYEMFDQQLHREALAVLELEGELRRAIINNEFEPYLQPIVRLDNGSVLGYEALLRWRHPTRGVLAPGDFLKVAEDLGCIETIDWLMFEQSCLAAASLPDETCFVTINVSPRHFRHADLDQRLLELAERTGLAPQRLHVEVTEGTLLVNSDQVRDILARLRGNGMQVALDDFGTGYSSLGYLHRFPLQILKIDRSFVSALDASDGEAAGAACVRAILALALSLGMEVIAEGIETTGQRDALLQMGCSLGQGYLYARPQPVAHWLAPPDVRVDA